jgi:hypothetical protein
MTSLTTSKVGLFCEGLLHIFYNEFRLITKRILNPNNVFITQNLHDITKKINIVESGFKHHQTNQSSCLK